MRPPSVTQSDVARYPGDLVDVPTFAFDGSYGDSQGGWGSVLLEPIGIIRARKGPIVLDTIASPEIRVGYISNNTAELAAIIGTCRWVASLAPLPTHVNFLFDSMWASNCARCLWRARLNSTEVDAARRALESLSDLGITVRWSHARWHRGHFLNELADFTAKLGMGSSATGELDLSSLRSLATGEVAALIDRHLELTIVDSRRVHEPEL